MENVRFEVYREGGPKRVVRLALVDGIDSTYLVKKDIYLVTKSIDGEIENILLKLDRDTGIFHLVGSVCDDTGLPLDEKGRVLVHGFNNGEED